MKKVITLFIIVLSVLSYESFAQYNLVKFKASEGASRALTEAANAGISNPEILMIMTAEREVPAGSFGNIGVEVSKTTGTATAWLYKIKSADDASQTKLFGMAKVPMVGLYPMDFSDYDVGVLPFTPSKTIPSGWKDSDEIFSLLANNSIYSKFVSDYPFSIVLSMILAYNDELPIFEKEKPYWGAFFKDETSGKAITCYVQAISGEVTCKDNIAGINELNNSVEYSIYPNPAQEVAYLKIPANIQSNNSRLQLINTQGNIIYEFPNLFNDGSLEYLSIPLNFYSNGAYIVRYISNGQIYDSKLIINR